MNYEIDYCFVVELVKEEGIFFVGINIFWKYVSLVYKEGFEVLEILSIEEKFWIVLFLIVYDFEFLGYKKMLDMIVGYGGENFFKV